MVREGRSPIEIPFANPRAQVSFSQYRYNQALPQHGVQETCIYIYISFYLQKDSLAQREKGGDKVDSRWSS